MKRKRGPITVAPGAVERLLTPAEVGEWIERWLSAFPADRRGIHADQYLWHVFSYGRYPAAARDEALAAYGRASAPEYVVISNDRDEGFVTRARPTSCSFSDWLVSPTDLSWTMAFTHEDGLIGPFFARRSR